MYLYFENLKHIVAFKAVVVKKTPKNICCLTFKTSLTSWWVVHRLLSSSPIAHWYRGRSSCCCYGGLFGCCYGGLFGCGAWPFLVGGVICLVNSVNERDYHLLNSKKFLIEYLLLRRTGFA